jgi:hypothetical protein
LAGPSSEETLHGEKKREDEGEVEVFEGQEEARFREAPDDDPAPGRPDRIEPTTSSSVT